MSEEVDMASKPDRLDSSWEGNAANLQVGLSVDKAAEAPGSRLVACLTDRQVGEQQQAWRWSQGGTWTWSWLIAASKRNVCSGHTVLLQVGEMH